MNDSFIIATFYKMRNIKPADGIIITKVADIVGYAEDDAGMLRVDTVTEG